MKKLIILVAALMLAMPAFAAVQNVKISGDIETLGVYQTIFDLNDASDDVDNCRGDEDSFIMTITRLRVDADLTDNVAATIRLINERLWGIEVAGYDTSSSVENTDVDLDLAYVTLKEMFYSPLTLMIGRQELAYGSKLVIGDPDTNAEAQPVGLDAKAEFLSKRKAFDAVRGILDYDPWTVDLVYAKVDESTVDEGAEDEDIYGANLAYKFADYDAEAEGYVFFVNGDANAAYLDAGDSGAGNNIDAYVIGLRGSLVPVDGLTLGAEIAMQGGDYLTDSSTNKRDIDATAATLEGSYKWDNEYEPAIKLCYNYRSGAKEDKDPYDTGITSDMEAWLPLYEDQTNGLVADYLFSGVNNGVSSNCHIISLGGSIKPMEDLTIALDWFHYILDEKLVASDGASYTHFDADTVGSSVTMNDDDNFGDEIDLALTYDYSEDVVIGLQVGYFMPGDAFNTANDDEALEVIGSVAVSF